jgi:hypothetical protein
MAEDIDVPKVGKFPKKIIIPIAVAAAAFVGYRYWVARNDTGTGEDAAVSDFAAEGTAPGVIGAVSPNNAYGGDTGATGDVSNPLGRFTTNAEWTDYVVGKLQQSESWTYNEIVTAIGNGLAGKPTTTAQQDILRAAIAIGGNPPSGAITIVTGGNVPLTVAPGNARASAIGTDNVQISFDAVPGASSYQVYRSGVSSIVGNGNSSPITVGGLRPTTTYYFTVAAVTAAGTLGPKSGTVTAKTKSISLAKPATPTISSLVATSSTRGAAVAKTTAVPGADGYHWYLNGSIHGFTEGPAIQFTDLKRRTKYTVTVAADVSHQAQGPKSNGRTFTSK